jgi:hypothetical integral membrane protein (TIGR02206 family)
MDSAPAFRPFGPAHWTVIALTVGFPLVFWATARGPGKEACRAAVRYTFAALLLANWIGYLVLRAREGLFTPLDLLPMQLCDWATIATIAALVTCRQWLFEPAYFWGLAGTLQAIVTPALSDGFPSPRFFNFFIGHCGVVVAVLFLTLVERLRPRPASILRTLLWSEIYLAAALFLNGWLGANYGFLSHTPPTRSILDYLSSNHWLYVAELNLLAVCFYLVLYLPFWAKDLIRPRAATAPDSQSRP